MIEFHFEITVLVCLLVSLFGIYKAAGTLNPGKVNVISAFYYLFLLQTFAGIALIVLGFDKHYTLNRLINRDETIEITFWVIMVAAVFIPFCIFLFEKLFRINAKNDYSTYLSQTVEVSNEETIYKVIVIGTIIGAVLMIVWFMKIGYIPALMLVHSPEQFDFALERSRIGNIYLIHPYISNILILTCIPLLSYLAFTYALVKKEKKWYILFGILFIMSLLVKTYNFAKSPVVYHLVVFLMIYIYCKGGISKKILAAFLLLSIAGIIFMYWATGYEGAILDIYNGPIGRTLFSQLGALLCVFDAFPQFFGFLNGRSLSAPLLPLLGMNSDMHLRSGKLMMDFYGSEGVYDGGAGVLNSFFVGEAYANYGWKGVIFSFIWVSLMFVILFAVVLKLKKTPMMITFFAAFTLKMPMATQGGFFDFIFSVDFIVTGIVFLMGYYLLERKNMPEIIYKKIRKYQNKKNVKLKE